MFLTTSMQTILTKDASLVQVAVAMLVWFTAGTAIGLAFCVVLGEPLTLQSARACSGLGILAILLLWRARSELGS